MKPRKKIQNLRSFTAQVRNVDTDFIVGTGFVISQCGKIVTCAHVVQDASSTREASEGTEVTIYFPQVRNPQMKRHSAKVVGRFQQYDDDVILLQLTSLSLPDDLKVAVLGIAKESTGNRFKSFGYRRLANYQGLPAEGRIIDLAEPPESFLMQADPVMLESQHIDSGMSGSAVLDITRDLVVGIISETWDSETGMKDRDTCFAVDNLVLTFDPLSINVENLPLPEQLMTNSWNDELESIEDLNLVPQAKIDINNAPSPLNEWVGREKFLEVLDDDWSDSDRLITGLIGFGGEGKSSLTRQWLDNSLANSSIAKPKGVFWWGFYENQNVDSFFEAVLTFLVEGIDPQSLPSTSIKAKVINAMLQSGRYLFVLDGLEVLQHADGDDYGLIKNTDLCNFLQDFASTEHESFCLISSRAPLLDLIDCATYTHRDVERLSPDEGLSLLKNIGVKGSDSALTEIVHDWDGYALVLSLLGAYLAERYNGDVKYIQDIPSPSSDEPRYHRVSRVLRSYDEHLTEAERIFLRIFSAFRLPVGKLEFRSIFRLNNEEYNKSITALNDKEFDNLVDKLIRYRILRFNQKTGYYTIHPVIREHYNKQLKKNNKNELNQLYKQIKNHYLNLNKGIVSFPTLENMESLFEVIHYLCQMEAYEQAWDVYWKSVSQRERFVLTARLGAYETQLKIFEDFFPDKDFSQKPYLEHPIKQHLILDNTSFALMGLGHLKYSYSCYETAKLIALNQKSWVKVSKNRQKFAELLIYLGELSESKNAAKEALGFAQRANSKWDKMASLTYLAQTYYLLGKLEKADETFIKAEELQRAVDLNVSFLYGWRGILYVEYLRRTGDLAYAKPVAQENLEICERKRWINSIGKNYYILGNIYSDLEQHDDAIKHYNKSLKILRSISRKDSLIEGLLARGCWAAKQGRIETAFSDLEEALNYAVSGNYCIYEIDIRVGLAWAYFNIQNLREAKSQSEKARKLSVAIGYYWGKINSTEIISEICSLFPNVG